WTGKAVFSVSPAEKILTSNRFSLLGHQNFPDSGHDPGPFGASIATTTPHQLSSVASVNGEVDESPSKRFATCRAPKHRSRKGHHSIVATSGPIAEVHQRATPPS